MYMYTEDKKHQTILSGCCSLNKVSFHLVLNSAQCILNELFHF